MNFTLYHVKMPLVSHFETSFGRVHSQESIIVRIDKDGLTGWGECPASNRPGFSYETVKTVVYVITEFLVPAIKKTGDLRKAFSTVRGHEMAKCGLEMAFWDLAAKKKNVPLASLYTKNFRKEIKTGISIGIQDSPKILVEKISNALDKKYHRIKIKIKPGWDVDVVRVVRKEFPKIELMVDANAAYTLNDVDHLKKLDEFNLMMIEQPMWHDDYVQHAKLTKSIKTFICLDEPIRSARDAEAAISLKSCKIINIKQSRVGGPLEAKKVHDICMKNKIPVFCGGMLETGIGRLFNIALASMPNFTLPGDISASARYYTEDIIDPPVTLTGDGSILVPNGNSVSHNINEKKLNKYVVYVKKCF